MDSSSGWFAVPAPYQTCFRRAKEIDDILSLAAKEEESSKVPFDELLTVQGDMPVDIRHLAQEHYDVYAANIQVRLTETLYVSYIILAERS